MYIFRDLWLFLKAMHDHLFPRFEPGICHNCKRHVRHPETQCDECYEKMIW